MICIKALPRTYICVVLLSSVLWLRFLSLRQFTAIVLQPEKEWMSNEFCFIKGFFQQQDTCLYQYVQ